jgi:hypothetical protein
MRPALAGLKTAFSQPTFLACVVILGASAAGLEATVRILGLEFRKQPIPLRRPLDQLDPAKLLPRYQLAASHSLNPDVLDELGTDQYLNATLRDTSRGENDPLALARVFITYYTGDPDQVPHVPDVCYLGSGFERRSSDKLYLDVPELGPLGRHVPVRVLTFGKRSLAASQEIVVLYLFSANGSFESDRQRLRLLLGNPFERYAYFSKVEISFLGLAEPQQTIQAGLSVLRKLLPILVHDHWPDWQNPLGLADRQADPPPPRNLQPTTFLQ